MSTRIRQSLMIGSLAQSVFLASMGTSMANLALPAIGEEFGIQFSQARLVVVSYLFATTAFSLVVGRLADLKGRRLVLVSGTALFVAATVLAASAPAYWILVLARLLQGIGAAALVVLPIVIATETASPDRTGRSIGLLATMSAVGTASGPSLGGVLLSSYGWRSMFVAMAVLGAINLLLFHCGTNTNQVDKQERPGGRNLLEVVRAVVLDRSLGVQLLYNLVVAAVMMTTLIVGPYYLTSGLHLAPVLMGLVLSVGPLTSTISGLFSGFLVDRWGARLVVVLGFIQLLVGTLSFVFLPKYFGVVGFGVSAALLSLGYQLFLSANSSRIMKAVSSERRGLVSGALSLSRNLGLIGGASVLGEVFDRFGLAVVFAASALLIALSLAIFFVNEQRRKNETRFSVLVH